MAIPIRFLTVLLKKSTLKSSYPGGLLAFLEDYPYALQDDSLAAVVFMSNGEGGEFVELLGALGVDLANGCALADMTLGGLDICRGIEISRRETCASATRQPTYWAMAVE